MNRHARRAYSRNLCQIKVLIEFLRPRMYEFKNSGLGLIVSYFNNVFFLLNSNKVVV